MSSPSRIHLARGTRSSPSSTPLLLTKRTSMTSEHDASEREADRVAEEVFHGSTRLRGATTVRHAPTSPVQRQESATPKTEGEKYKEAGKKLGEAFLETPPGKEIEQKAKDYGEAFVSTLPGKIITGTAIAGAVAGLAATHRELPIGIPEIPLDRIRPGLKLQITYEGPVDAPTKVAASFSIPLPLGLDAKPKPAATGSDRYRAETARLAAEQQRFREGLKTPQERADDARLLDTWLKSRPGGPGVLDLRLTGERPATELPVKKAEDEKSLHRKPAPGATSHPVREVPPLVGDVLRGGGRPLDPATRGEMEARFGRDFRAVRIHDDAHAGRSAEAVSASAYTVGRHIVFGASRFAPRSVEGRRLLAHELAHVVQQSGPAPAGPAIQRQTKRKRKEAKDPPKSYQYVIDALEDQRQLEQEQRSKSPYLVHEHLNIAGLRALLVLSEAVEQERAADIPKALDGFIAKDYGFHLGTISEGLMIELSVRLFRLGLEAESARLRKHFSDQNATFFGSQRVDEGGDRRTIRFFEALVERATTAADASTPEKASTSLDLLIRAFVPLRDALGAVDMEALRWEKETGSGRLVFRPGLSREEYHDGLVRQVEKLFGGLEGMLQALIDGAAADLAAGRGSATLELTRRILETRLRPVLFPSNKKQDIAGLRLRTTRTTLTKGRGSIDDAFAKGREPRRRRVAITTYLPSQEYTQELHMSLERLFEVRSDQVSTLARIYGVQGLVPVARDKDGVLSEDAARNAAAIKKLEGGRLRLHSDDDWRAFVLQKYRDLVQPTEGRLKVPPGEALGRIMDLLFAYMRAFTVHARYTNIYDDVGDSYLNRDFPRALSGQLVHDCGVYALRVAYILSRVRGELGLRFRFVVLPAHIALVIDGEDLPAFIVHNDHYEELSPKEWSDIRTNWEKFTETKRASDPSGTVTAEVQVRPPGQRDVTQFIGEVAGASFISGPLDIPFSVADVPRAGGEARAAQAKLWAFYKETARTKLFGPASDKKGGPDHLFHMRYLGLTERMRDMHNETTRKFWNDDAPAAWEVFERQLAGDGKRRTIPAAELSTLLRGHRDAFAKAVAPVDARFASLEAEQRSISARLRDDPKLRARGARIGYGPRAATLWTYHWVKYRGRLERFIEDLAKQPTSDVALLSVRTRLDPPFVPREDKALRVLD